MTQEEKQELLIALCGYLPYGLKIKEYNEEYGFNDSELSDVSMKYFADDEASAEGYWINRIENIKPYLRPFSSMTEGEFDEIKRRWVFTEDCRDENDLMDVINRGTIDISDAYSFIDWLNKKHFDYRGLIEKGLALEAPKDMYVF